MERSLRADIWGQICGANFPRENLKCFQLLPVENEIVEEIISKLKNTISEDETNEKCLISIQNITKIDHSDLFNWNCIKKLFRNGVASCMWLQDPAKIDIKTEYDLQEHISAYRVKLKYELLVNLRDKLDNYQKLVNEVAWHKMICWFNTGNTGTLDHYLNTCLSELTKMKQEIVVKGVNLYDFVMKDKEGLDKIALYHQDKHEEMAKKFPNYKEIIEAAFKMAYERQELLRNVDEIQVFVKKSSQEKVTLDYGSTRHLANYLGNSEINILIKTFE